MRPIRPQLNEIDNCCGTTCDKQSIRKTHKQLQSKINLLTITVAILGAALVLTLPFALFPSS